MSELALQLIAENKNTKAATLNLGNCGLTQLPPEALECTWIETLILSGYWSEYDFENKKWENQQSQNKGEANKITSLPPTHPHWPLLKKLVLNNNQIADLAPIANLTNLQILSCYSNQIADLAPIAQLTNLQQLYCYSNQIADLAPIAQLTNLQILYCSSNQIADLSPIAQLTNLQQLSFHSNQIADLAPIAQLTNLQILYCSSNQIADLAPIAQLTNLQLLFCYSNQIADLAPIAQLTNLQQLYCYSNQIADLAPIAQLTNLQILYCSSNQIADLSPIAQLTNLQILYCSSNQIADLAPIGNLTNLQQLSCDSNQIADLSPLLFLIKKGIPLKWQGFGEHRKENPDNWEERPAILVKDNPLTNPPVEIAQQGNNAILNFFKQAETQGTVPLYEAKLIVVGEPGAGKTSLTEKLWNETHPVIPNDPAKESTLGINIRENWRFPDCKRTGEDFISHIWDFGGQEIQYMTHQFFLTPESLYVLVADDRKQHTLFPYWFEVIHLLGKDDGGKYSPIIIVLNERNNKSITNFDLDEYRLKYPKTRIEVVEVDLCDKNLDRFRVAKSKIQQSLCSLDHIGRLLPSMWPKIRAALLELSKAHNHINEAKFADICQRFDINSKEDQQLIGKYLHQLGVILHFQNDLRLRDFIVISPKWALKAVYAVLEDKEVEKNHGRFTDADLDRYWQNLTSSERINILDLMMKENFEICYPISQGVYIAPQLLPQRRPEFAWDSKSSLKCQFFYRFMPKGIMTRLIVRKHKDLSKNDVVWARGAIFNRSECDILVTEEETERNGLIAIEVKGKDTNRIRALDYIRNEIEEIHRKWFDNIEYEERAPCNCTHCIHSPKPTFFDWKKLMQRVEEGRRTIECDHVKVKDVEVIPLIEGYSGRQRLRNWKNDRRLTDLQMEASNSFTTKKERMQDQPKKGDTHIHIHGGTVGNVSGTAVSQQIENQNATPPEKPEPAGLNKTSKMNKTNIAIAALAFIAFLFIVNKMFNSSRASEAGLGKDGVSVKVGEEKAGETLSTTTLTKEVTVTGSVKINSRNAWSEDVKQVYIKGQTLGDRKMLSGNVFVLRDVQVKQDKIIEVSFDLKNGLTNSAAFKLPQPDKDNVSDVGEVLIDVKPPTSKGWKTGSNGTGGPQIVINNQNIQQSGEGNKATQEKKVRHGPPPKNEAEKLSAGKRIYDWLNRNAEGIVLEVVAAGYYDAIKALLGIG